MRERFLPDGVERALHLGCGAGLTDRAAVEAGLCRQVDGIDVSADAIALARERGERAGLRGLNYRVSDVNSVELPPHSYDLVIFAQSLHHVEALEHVLDQVRRSLRPGGWLVLAEYVGPSRLQWTDEQLAVANRLLALLPERLRRAWGCRDRILTHIGPPENLAAEDPSEAIRPGEIPSLVQERFRVVARRDFGGTVLFPLLQGLTANFDPADETDNAILRLLVAFEDTLLTDGALPSDFTLIVGRRD